MTRTALLLAVCVAGCSMRPTGVDPVDVNPGAAASKAMELYDTDGDGMLAGEELAQAPGIVMAKARYDTDGDGAISQAEIKARLQQWKKQPLGFRELTMSASIDGRPISGVEVRLVPEPYLGDAVKPATGRARPDGSVTVSVAQDDLPSALKNRGVKLYGVTGGTYKIEFVGENAPTPEMVSPDTPLGLEVAHDTIAAVVYLRLRSR